MDNQEKYQACVDELRQTAEALGFTDVVLGLSGGIDSSLVAVMCVDAFGAEHVHGFMMPGPYSTQHSVDDATELAQNLGLQTQTISIKEAYEGFAAALAPAVDGKLEGLASENTQARCRMVCLMALSNHHGWMLVNTGNKSEAAMGFSTLYGDTAGVFAPIGGLYKTDVFALSRWVNERAQDAGQVPPIPEHVLTKPPSAELSPDAEDEKSLGIDYATLDKILIAYYEQGMLVDEIIDMGFEREQIEGVVKRVDSYAFKRALEPPYPQARFYA